jgi:hypothetical protein
MIANPRKRGIIINHDFRTGFFYSIFGQKNIKRKKSLLKRDDGEDYSSFGSASFMGAILIKITKLFLLVFFSSSMSSIFSERKRRRRKKIDECFDYQKSLGQ